MAGLLRKILPVVSSIPRDVDDDDAYNVEYSFAMEYHGPPVTHDIPRVVPVDIDQIPTAAAVVSASPLNNLSLPVIQPIVKSNPLSKKSPDRAKLGVEATGSSPNSVIPCEQRATDDSDCVLSSAADSSGMFDSVDGERCAKKSTDGIGSSGSLGFSDSPHHSHDLSESSDVLELPDDCEEISPELGLSSGDPSSEVSSCKEEHRNNGTPRHVKRPSTVTFRDPELSHMVYEESSCDVPEIVQERPPPRSNVKKGLCYRCLKGNRFTVKEVCIVCSAKYCGHCVLRAMGSMPEGRKCVTCIGYRIDESKRGALGKCSRILKRLLTNPEIKQIMISEILCETNQLPSERVLVNGKALCHEEMVRLRTCENPPKKLKPGNYWYDKVSGLWGKEGQKPCQIISPHLDVGDQIREKASNGNTKVKMNNREITKEELWMLKLAGVECEGHPHFWVSADGSYQEEGQKNVKGRIWDRTGMKLVCAILSLPTPSDIANPCGEEVNNVSGVVPEQNTLHKLLLVGYSRSGTSTIFKQAKLLYNVRFSEDERQNIKFMIQSNLYGYLGILLERREQFEEESLIERRKRHSIDRSGPSGNTGQGDNKTIYSIGPKLKAFSDWLLQVKMSGNLESIFPTATREYAPLVEELWKDAAIQATYNRRSELEMIPRVASYFLHRAVEISRTDYEPSDTDILYAEGTTSSKGLASMEFSLPKSAQDGSMEPADQHDPSLSYQLIRVHARSLGKNGKWLEMFEDVKIVLFSVSLTDYDQFSEDDNGIRTNKMLASKKLFESIVTHPTSDSMEFLLILNKFDLLEEKIERVPLTQCEWFNDFNPMISQNHHHCSSSRSSVYPTPPLAQRAFHYIAVKFKRLFTSLTGRKLYVSLVTGLEPDTVDEALKYAGEILKWASEEGIKPSDIDLSSCSNEVSSSS